MTRDHVDDVRGYLDDVIKITENSECVDETAQQALKEPISAIESIEAAIKDARTDGARAVGIAKRAEAVSQSLLEVRNFSVAALMSNAVKKVGESAWRGALKGVETGTEKVVSTAIVTGSAVLVAKLVSSWAGLALFVGSFGPLAKKGEKQTSQEAEENDDDNITEA